MSYTPGRTTCPVETMEIRATRGENRICIRRRAFLLQQEAGKQMVDGNDKGGKDESERDDEDKTGSGVIEGRG